MVRTEQIGYTEDIVKELAQELGIPESEVAEIVELNIKYIRKSSLEKDYVLINLPNLCKLRLNLRMAMSTVKQSKTKKGEALKKKIQTLWEYKQNHRGERLPLNFKESLFSRYFREINTLSRIKYISRNIYKVIEGIEIKAHEIIAKIR